MHYTLENGNGTACKLKQIKIERSGHQGSLLKEEKMASGHETPVEA